MYESSDSFIRIELQCKIANQNNFVTFANSPFSPPYTNYKAALNLINSQYFTLPRYSNRLAPDLTPTPCSPAAAA